MTIAKTGVELLKNNMSFDIEIRQKKYICI